VNVLKTLPMVSKLHIQHIMVSKRLYNVCTQETVEIVHMTLGSDRIYRNQLEALELLLDLGARRYFCIGDAQHALTIKTFFGSVFEKNIVQRE
jgi:hypothetical protein